MSFKGYVENMAQLDGPQMPTRYNTEKMQEYAHTHAHL